ncbi:MAG: hypothetical protein OXC92_10855 [Flavobacteriaceae bacterium]|nr:hypothetical protein [Flavobacteriaceae bacterium]MCY4254220.1 hypothetical protein [Flavobacteriaceae bacterium]
MYSKITIISTLVAFVVFNVLAYIIYGWLMSDALPSDPMSRDWGMHIMATLVFSYVMTLIYLKLRGRLSIKSGLLFGFLIGLLFTVGEGLMLVSIGQMGLTDWVSYALTRLLLYSLVGGSIGLTAGKLKE